ncbi:hypothetical protein N658DRAFT_49961 [Parathielavia hyrcaniae]|uniref:Uncharacterized protein n=1 Tax=Parathielavia hyrcaniae TaxID=113614 RepID=A0AAN6T1H3_9PEZI|nr:hypothetical protein N658DRAFT_49961 [Parathielavia hyrcaniae]
MWHLDQLNMPVTTSRGTPGTLPFKRSSASMEKQLGDRKLSSCTCTGELKARFRRLFAAGPVSWTTERTTKRSFSSNWHAFTTFPTKFATQRIAYSHSSKKTILWRYFSLNLSACFKKPRQTHGQIIRGSQTCTLSSGRSPPHHLHGYHLPLVRSITLFPAIDPSTTSLFDTKA